MGLDIVSSGVVYLKTGHFSDLVSSADMGTPALKHECIYACDSSFFTQVSEEFLFSLLQSHLRHGSLKRVKIRLWAEIMPPSETPGKLQLLVLTRFIFT